MKLTHLLSIGAAAIALAGTAAAATTTIVITGSSAYRSSVHKAIINILGGTVTGTTATLPAAGGIGGFAYAHANDFTKANGATFRGYLNADGVTDVTIKTSWTGSAAGIQTVASTNNSFTVRVLPAATALSTSGTANLADPTSNSNPADTLLPDIAMADNRQVATPFNGTFNGEPYTTLTATKVGIVPFVWVRSLGAPSSIANMTPAIARSLWTGTGRVPLSFFSGNDADRTTFVYATGRDPDSGTRITAFAESGVGINTPTQQYDCATEQLYAEQTVNGIFLDIGEGGEKSGGTLAGNTKMGKSGLTKYYVSYMSSGDAATLEGLGGARLTYNGIGYTGTSDDVLVQQGKYSFWGNEFILWKPTLGGVKLTTATTLKDQILNTDAALKLSTMKVTRTAEGGTITAQ